MLLTPTAAEGVQAAATEDSFSTNAAYLTKMQMLRELGFLTDTSAEAEALARSRDPSSSLQDGAVSADSIDQQVNASTEASGVGSQKEEAAMGTAPKAKAAQRSPEER